LAPGRQVRRKGKDERGYGRDKKVQVFPPGAGACEESARMPVYEGCKTGMPAAGVLERTHGCQSGVGG
jgi:hypothetical protein